MASFSYEPLWETMKSKNITAYSLMTHFGIRKSTIDRLKRNQNITIATLTRLCEILDCEPNDIVRIIKN